MENLQRNLCNNQPRSVNVTLLDFQLYHKPKAGLKLWGVNFSTRPSCATENEFRLRKIVICSDHRSKISSRCWGETT